MKKVLVILLLIMYGSSSFGMTLHLHYCCGKLDKVDFTPPKSKHCEGGMDRHMTGKSCCDNKQIDLKITSDQDPAKVFLLSASAALKPSIISDAVISPIQTKKLLPEIFAPPPLEKNLNRLYCVYQI